MPFDGNFMADSTLAGELRRLHGPYGRYRTKRRWWRPPMEPYL